MVAGVQTVVLFLSSLVLVSLLWWLEVGPTCWLETRIQLIPAYQQRQWTDVESAAGTEGLNILHSEAHDLFGQENVKCKPKHKVIFAKTHKTGGTSVQVGICFSRYLHDWSEYSLQSWGGMGPALCAPSWTSSSLFPSLHLLSDGHGTNLREQGAELRKDDHEGGYHGVFHVSGEVQHVCLTLQMGW